MLRYTLFINYENQLMLEGMNHTTYCAIYGEATAWYEEHH